MDFYLASYLPTLLMQLVFLALYIVGVVRSRGVARILLAVWVAVTAISTVLSTVLLPVITEAVGFPGYGLIFGIISALGSILLGVALIIGRPGYRGEDDRPVYGQPGPYPPQGGPYGYARQPPQGYRQP